MQGPIEAPLYTPSPGDRVRIVLDYGDAWRPVFWVEIEKDGSIYLAPRFKNIGTLRSGSKDLTEGSVSVEYAEGEEIVDPKLREGVKFSFHSSGVVHIAGMRSFRESTRSISSQRQLFRVLFQHPSGYSPVATVRKRDICLKYPVDEVRPLQCTAFIAPADCWSLVRLSGVEHQINLLLQYSGLENVPDLMFQLVLWHSVAGDWPPYTYVLFDAIKSNSDGIGGEPNTRGSSSNPS